MNECSVVSVGEKEKGKVSHAENEKEGDGE